MSDVRTSGTPVKHSNDYEYKKPSTGLCTLSCFAGIATANVLTQPVQKVIGSKAMDELKTMSRASADEYTQLENGTKQVLSDSGLDKKGVTILKNNLFNKQKIADIIKTEMDKRFKFFPEMYRKDKMQSTINMINSGQNAAYIPSGNAIIMPEKDLVLSTYHEIGHAANANFSKIGSILQKIRPMGYLVVPVSFIALIKTKKAPGEKSQSALGKTTDFIKENAGKLTFLGFMPILIEEAMASIKGEGFAKKVLSPELLKKVSKSNKIAYSTYLALATLSSVGIALGVRVKDAIAKPELVRKES